MNELDEDLTFTQVLLRCKDGIGALRHVTTPGVYTYILPDNVVELGRTAVAGDIVRTVDLSYVLEASGKSLTIWTDDAEWRYHPRPTFSFKLALKAAQAGIKVSRTAWDDSGYLGNYVERAPEAGYLRIANHRTESVSEEGDPIFTAADITADDWYVVPTRYVRHNVTVLPIYA